MVNIISWNTCGDCITKLNEIYGSLTEDKNVIMIQEAGALKGIDAGIFNISFGSSDRGRNFKAAFFGQPSAVNPKCTTGILVEGNLDENPNIYIFYPDNTSDTGIGKRPIVCYETTFTDDETGKPQKYVFATVHLTACADKAKEELENLNISFRNQFDANDCWFIIGDFNCDPTEFKPVLLPANIVYTREATFQTGKRLDFAIFSDSLVGKVSPLQIFKKRMAMFRGEATIIP